MDRRRRLFVASCAALVVGAMTFSICTDVMGDFERVFHLTKAQVGEAVSWGAIGGVAVLFLGGALLDFIGIARVFWLAFASYLVGLTMVILAQGFWTLAVAWLFLAIAGSLVQAAISPLAATLYPENKTRIMNHLHAWFPGGLILGGLLAYGLTKLLALPAMPDALRENAWRIKLATAFVPAVLFAVLIVGQKFPKTERVQAGVSAGAMFREALRPMFLVLVFCMCLTASVELGPNRWVGVFIQDIVGIRGILMLIYTSGLMFALRFLAGPLAKRISSTGMLLGSSLLSGLGLVALSYATGPVTLFLAATVFGVGVTYFWPTMLGTTAERFPKGGAFLLGIVGAAAGLFLAYVTVPQMGRLHDHYTLTNLPPAVAEQVVVAGRVDAGRAENLGAEDQAALDQARKTAASTTFRYVAILSAVLLVVFSGILLHDRLTRRRGQGEPAANLGPPPGEQA